MAAILARLKGRVFEGVEGLGRFFDFMGSTLRYTFTSWPSRGTLILTMYEVGNRSFPVVMTTGLFVGMVLGVGIFDQLHRLSVPEGTGPIIAVAMVRQIGPILAAVVLAGRVGGAMTAELGTMRVTEQIDALRTLGTSPVRHLVVPRFIACLVLVPVLTAYSDAIGIVGGWLVCVVTYGTNNFKYWDQTMAIVRGWDVLVGILKSVVFGGLIGLVACYKGFQVRESGGAQDVGRATTSSFVMAFVMILVTNFFMEVFFQAVDTLGYWDATLHLVTRLVDKWL